MNGHPGRLRLLDKIRLTGLPRTAVSLCCSIETTVDLVGHSAGRHPGQMSWSVFLQAARHAKAVTADRVDARHLMRDPSI